MNIKSPTKTLVEGFRCHNTKSSFYLRHNHHRHITRHDLGHGKPVYRKTLNLKSQLPSNAKPTWSSARDPEGYKVLYVFGLVFRLFQCHKCMFFTVVRCGAWCGVVWCSVVCGVCGVLFCGVV